MKFSYKILLCSIITMAVSFGIGGYFFVNDVFRASLEREIGQAADDSSILKFAFETAALNIPSKYDMLQNAVVEEIGANLENKGQGTKRLLRLSDENRAALYVSEGFVGDSALLMEIGEQTRAYQIIHTDEHYYVQTGVMVDALNRMLYLETMRDVTEVYAERSRGFAVYRGLTILLLILSSVFMYFISYWLTKPIRLLTRATRRMTAGDYSYRAEQISSDEMGQLTLDFNHMSRVVEENIHKLEDEIRAREDFIAAFSHELKTPLTAVIGYADLLRSRKLDDEKHFLSANYIYTEGKRLESMSLRLLDIIVTKRYRHDPQNIDVKVLFEYLRDMYAEKKGFRFHIDYESCRICAEADLIKTVLLNLTDNACKASDQGSQIEITGIRKENGYLFAVKDHGTGIPEEECKKITEAFYMVDKSRSRSHNGAGLGLALCSEILKLHGSELMIESALDVGSCFSFLLPDRGGIHNETDGQKESGDTGYGPADTDNIHSGSGTAGAL